MFHFEINQIIKHDMSGGTGRRDTDNDGGNVVVVIIFCI